MIVWRPCLRCLSIPISDSKHEFLRANMCDSALKQVHLVRVEIKEVLLSITDLICQFQASSCLVSLERGACDFIKEELMEINLNEMGV